MPPEVAIPNAPAQGHKIDSRASNGRRLKVLVAELKAELGGDLTSGERIRLEAAASLMLLAEQQRAALASGKSVDPVALESSVNGAARLIAGLKSGRAEPMTGARALAEERAGRIAGADA